jgi:hypothetical protein
MSRKLTLALLTLPLAACSGDEAPPEPSASGDAPAAAASADGPWTAFQDQGALFIKAGRSSGLVMDAAVTMLGAPIGGTSNRRVIGFGNVAEVWDDMVRVEATHLDSGAAGDGMVARRPGGSDLAVVAGLPKP